MPYKECEGYKVRTPVLLALLLAAVAVSAANVTLTPLQVYETTTVWESIDVDNYGGSSVVSSVSAFSPNLTIQNAKNYTGWSSNSNGNTASWTGGTIETNVRSALFEFQVTAPKISANYTVPVTVTLDGTPKVFNLEILNDNTPPNVTSIQPQNYARANNPAQQIILNINDPETGVDTVTYSWNNCGNGSSTSVVLTNSNSTWSGTADFSAFNEGQTACYRINATNKGGESVVIDGQLQFDGTPPTVTLVSPTTYATQSTEFIFNASDNIASQLSCVVKFETTNLTTVSAVSKAHTSTTQNLSGFSEGTRAWSVECQDGVGLLANAVQSVVLDLAPPQLTSNVSATMPRTVANQFTITVTDATPTVLNATLDGNVVLLSQNGNVHTGFVTSSTVGTKVLRVVARDSVGNVVAKDHNITFVPNHQLSLTLNPSIADSGDSVTASGTLTEDGDANETIVTITTPGGDVSTALSGNSYSVQFTAGSEGTHTITAKFVENGHTYTAQATLQVNDPDGNSGNNHGFSDGIGAAAWRTSGYAVENEQPEEGNSEQIEEQVEEKDPNDFGPRYNPIEPETPRRAATPQATGIFNLGKSLNWLLPLLAVIALLGLAAYAYSRRPKGDKKGGVDWDGYFDGS